MHILFNKKGRPITPNDIRLAIDKFGNSYNSTTEEIIKNSENDVNRNVFFKNMAILMPNFKMTRGGPFKGIQYIDEKVIDPKGQIAACWKSVGKNAVNLRKFLDKNTPGSRSRTLVEISNSARKKVSSELWEMFKNLIPLCIGEYTLGLVAASKVLFSVFPEVAQPIDNAQWKKVFKTIDYGDIIADMAAEIAEWEKASGRLLNECSPYVSFTLPAIYNVMAMKAR